MTDKTLHQECKTIDDTLGNGIDLKVPRCLSCNESMRFNGIIWVCEWCDFD